MKQIKITAMTVYVTDIPVRLMRRHGSGDVAGSVKNAILKLETDAGITGWGDAAPWAVFTGTIEANVAALNVYLRPLLIGADPSRIEQLMADADHAVVGHPEAKAAMEQDDVAVSATHACAELLRHGVTCFIDPGNYHPEATVAAAEKTGINALELRRRNLIRPEEQPYKNPSGCTYDNGDYGQSMDIALRIGAVPLTDIDHGAIRPWLLHTYYDWRRIERIAGQRRPR